MDRSKNLKCLWILEFAEVITRVWGIMTIIVLWGVGTDLAVHGHSVGSYILFLAVLLTILETAFAVNAFLDFYIKDDKHLIVQCYQSMQWLDLWKKSVLYVFFALFCFLRPLKLWLASIGGGMMLALALLYLLASYKVYLITQEALLFDKECSYDRFEDLQEEIDDSLPEPSGGNVGDQDQILQV